MKSYKSLYFIVASAFLLLAPLCINAQHNLKAGTWYAFDINKPDRIMQFTVAENNGSTGFFDIKKEWIVEKKATAEGEGKKKKKGGFGKLMKALAEPEKTSNTKEPATRVSLLADEMAYKVVTDNVAHNDDEAYMNFLKFDHSVGRLASIDAFGEDGDIQGVYGFTYPIEDGFYKEVVFFKKGKFKDENPDYLESIFVIGKDKEATRQKAASMDFNAEKKKYYTPDYSTGRTPNPVIEVDDYTSGLKLDEETGELILRNSITAYFLPNKTIEGRNINYNWEGLNVSLFSKDGALVKTIAPYKPHRNGRWVEKVRNDFDVSYGSFGKLKAGEYQLTFSIYNNEAFFTTDLEVYTRDNPDITAESSTYYLLKGAYDGYLVIDEDSEQEVEYKGALDFELMKTRMIDVIGEKNRVDAFSAKMYKNGKFFAVSSDYDGSGGSNKRLSHSNVLSIYNTPEDVRDALNSTISKSFSIINTAIIHGQWKQVDGNNISDGQYKIEYYTDGKLFAEASFEVKNKRIVPQGFQKKDAANSKQYIFTDPDHPRIYIPLIYKY